MGLTGHHHVERKVISDDDGSGETAVDTTEWVLKNHLTIIPVSFDHDHFKGSDLTAFISIALTGRGLHTAGGPCECLCV